MPAKAGDNNITLKQQAGFLGPYTWIVQRRRLAFFILETATALGMNGLKTFGNTVPATWVTVYLIYSGVLSFKPNKGAAAWMIKG